MKTKFAVTFRGPVSFSLTLLVLQVLFRSLSIVRKYINIAIRKVDVRLSFELR